MPYLSYEEYKTMGGTAQQTAFNILEVNFLSPVSYLLLQ